MNSDKDTDRTSKDDSGNRSLTPSVVELQRLIGRSPGYRNLTPYEIELLRRSKAEISEVAGKILASKKDASQRKPD